MYNYAERTLKTIQNFKEPFYYDIDDHRTDSSIKKWQLANCLS